MVDFLFTREVVGCQWLAYVQFPECTHTCDIRDMFQPRNKIPLQDVQIFL